MVRILGMTLLMGMILLLAGCGVDIPARLEVRDVSSGKNYSTYEPWGRVEKGIGYQFTDIQTGSKVTLTNYELKTLDTRKNVPGDSPEARAFNEAKARGGIN